MYYTYWRICDLTNLFVLWKVYVHIAEAGDNFVKKEAPVNIQDSFGRHSCMLLGPVMYGSYLH